jgi:hypothetical protein
MSEIKWTRHGDGDLGSETIAGFYGLVRANTLSDYTAILWVPNAEVFLNTQDTLIHTEEEAQAACEEILLPLAEAARLKAENADLRKQLEAREDAMQFCSGPCGPAYHRTLDPVADEVTRIVQPTEIHHDSPMVDTMRHPLCSHKKETDDE